MRCISYFSTSMLSVKNISKKQGEHYLLQDISFEQNAGEKIAIAGETGSGKTTLAKIVAGLGQAGGGEVLFEGKPVKGIHDKLMPGHKGIAYLSQYFELSNNYGVSELLAYANDLTEEFSKELYQVCRVDHLLDRWAQTLSGGEKQRVALAKLLTTKPRLLVLDEPFSNLDLIHKNQLKSVLENVQDHFKVSYILVSHDAGDILPWADKILVMRQGKLVQQDDAVSMYKHPNDEYVAGLFGKYTVLNEALRAKFTGAPPFIRPEELVLSNADSNSISATVTKVSFYGSYHELEVLAEGQTLTIRSNKSIVVGQQVYLSLLQKEVG
ncbi:MAG: ABC transporter ATP-binding protein [Sphingobacteriales bacterium]|nr:MAG: ABC transporter ATP-binding protein [Sphingobacteriales bacterium]